LFSFHKYSFHKFSTIYIRRSAEDMRPWSKQASWQIAYKSCRQSSFLKSAPYNSAYCHTGKEGPQFCQQNPTNYCLCHRMSHIQVYLSGFASQVCQLQVCWFHFATPWHTTPITMGLQAPGGLPRNLMLFPLSRTYYAHTSHAIPFQTSKHQPSHFNWISLQLWACSYAQFLAQSPMANHTHPYSAHNTLTPPLYLLQMQWQWFSPQPLNTPCCQPSPLQTSFFIADLHHLAFEARTNPPLCQQ
jgi:hypothetical protein